MRVANLKSSSPLVVTNPVTGWKALWGFSPISMRANGKIDGVTDYEHELMKAYCAWEAPHQEPYLNPPIVVLVLIMVQS